MSFSLTKWVGTSAVAGITAVTVFSSTASAFFPPLPIASNPPTTAPIVSPPPTATVPPSPTSPIQPVSPPPFVPPPVSPPPVDPGCHCHPVPPPACVPEPATIVTGAIGLTVMGVGALRRKFGKKTPKTEA